MDRDERRRRLSDLYHAAAARAPVDPDTFLREACAGDEALRQEVASLLQYESASARFLETPAAAVVADAARGSHIGAAMVGRTLGPYTIVTPLGAGGMGEVYRARDTRLVSRQCPPTGAGSRSGSEVSPLRAKSLSLDRTTDAGANLRTRAAGGSSKGMRPP